MRIKLCEICDNDYMAKSTKARYCCVECKQIALQLNQLRARQRYQLNKVKKI